jgi:hypothetical protein
MTNEKCYRPFHMIFETWSVFFLLGLRRPKYFSSARERWNSALILLAYANHEVKHSGTYMVFDSSSSSPLPAMALKADHRSLTFINIPDSRYI